MNFKKLGNTDLKVSTICLGTMTWGEQNTQKDAFEQMDYAFNCGVNFFDAAEIYPSPCKEETYGETERIIGNWFNQNKNREKIILASKIAGPGLSWIRNGGQNFSEQKIKKALEDSLQRLQTDYIDLYQLHFADPATPIEETLRALDDLVHQGKVRYIGCSNFSAWQTCEAIWTSRSLNLIPFVSVQPEYSLLSRGVEKELIPFCKEYSLGVLPYFPLASGFLTGKYRRGEPVPDGTRLASNSRAQERTLTDANFEMLERLENFAEEQGHPMVELAIAWLLGNPAVSSVIAGATKTDQVIANAKASGWQLVESDMEEVASILKGN